MNALKLNKDNFDSAIKSEKPVLIDFYADWCGPCRLVLPIVEEIAGERDDIVVAKINVDDEPELAERFGVFSIPTLVVMKNGEVNDCVVSGIHYDGYGADHKNDSIGKTFIENDPYTEYNTYGLEWNENEYIFYLNGVETGRLSTGGVSQNPEYLLLTVEFSGENGVASGDRRGAGKIGKTPDKNWPAEFVVDYVRCYQYK